VTRSTRPGGRCGFGTNGRIKTVLNTLQAYQGIGITRLMFTFELTNKEQGSTGYLMWLGGVLRFRYPTAAGLTLGLSSLRQRSRSTLGSSGKSVKCR
jgi:hypothetical protein